MFATAESAESSILLRCNAALRMFHKSRVPLVAPTSRQIFFIRFRTSAFLLGRVMGATAPRGLRTQHLTVFSNL